MHSPRLPLWCCVVAAALMLRCDSGDVQSAQSVRPNILWITVEDMSPHLGSYGDELARTPNLDRLAGEGIRYTRVFATAPVCSAARTALATGMYQTSIGGHQHRAGQSYDNFEHAPYQAVPPPYVKSFTEYLRTTGYYCTNNAKTDYNFGNPLTAWDENGREAHWRNRPDPDQPFFAVFNSARTHESRVWPNPEEEYVTDPVSVVLPPYYPDSPIIRRDYARMYDNINRMDGWVGDILLELEEDGLADNTIVFFFSDHGDGIPRAKRWLQDSGIQTPLIIRNPFGVEAGLVDSQLISFIDLSATVLSLAGVDIPDHFEGQAFLGAATSENPRSLIFAARDRMDESHDMRRAVRDGRYKYIRNFHPERPFLLPNAYRDRMPLMQELIRLAEADSLPPAAAFLFNPTKPPQELYDTWNDPYEIINLANDPAYADVLDRFRNELTTWQEETGDMGLIPETELSEMMWPGGVQPITEAPVITSTTAGNDSVKVTITAPTDGSSIAYTAEPGDSPRWHLYMGEVTLAAPVTLRARAIRYGFQESSEAVAAISLSMDPPER